MTNEGKTPTKTARYDRMHLGCEEIYKKSWNEKGNEKG